MTDKKTLETAKELIKSNDNFIKNQAIKDLYECVETETQKTTNQEPRKTIIYKNKDGIYCKDKTVLELLKIPQML